MKRRNGQHLAKLRVDNTSGYRGVWRRDDRWFYSLKDGDVAYYGGAYPSARAAAQAYDRVAFFVWRVRPNKELGLL